MNYLFYDTETTGFPDYKSPSASPHQPHIVQMAAILTDENFNELARMNRIVRADGWEIPEAVSLIHGITMERSLNEGRPEAEVMDEFTAMVSKAGARIAFNDPFDARIVRIYYKRSGLDYMAEGWKNFMAICAMKLAKPLCKMPPTEKMKAANFNTFKQPKLSEAVQILMGEEMVGAHDAIVDVEYTVKLYKYMLGK